MWGIGRFHVAFCICVKLTHMKMRSAYMFIFTLLVIESKIDDRFVSSIIGQPIKILHHQSTGHPNCCMKPVQSLFSLVFRCPCYLKLTALHIMLTHSCFFLSFSFCFSLRVFKQKRDFSQSNVDPPLPIPLNCNLVDVSLNCEYFYVHSMKL